MLHTHETKQDAAAEYAEARRAWELVHDVVLRDQTLGEANAQTASLHAGEPRAHRAEHQNERGEMITFRSYGKARSSLIDELLKDAAAHDEGRFDEIGLCSGRMHLPRVGPPELTKLRVALRFWNGWTEARNRSWPDGNIAKTEWSMLARRIAADLAEDREISDARVSAAFDVWNRRSQG